MILAFRHAAPIAQGVCYGRSDIPVALRAAEAAEIIRTKVAVPPAVVWSSPSRRCRGPGALLAKGWQVELRVDSRLFELDFGAWEQQPWSALSKTQDFQVWAQKWKEKAPPGGETLLELERRVRAWWRQAATSVEGVVIAHAGVLRALDVITGRVASWDEAMASPVPYLEVRRLVSKAPGGT